MSKNSKNVNKQIEALKLQLKQLQKTSQQQPQISQQTSQKTSQKTSQQQPQISQQISQQQKIPAPPTFNPPITTITTFDQKVQTFIRAFDTLSKKNYTSLDFQNMLINDCGYRGSVLSLSELIVLIQSHPQKNDLIKGILPYILFDCKEEGAANTLLMCAFMGYDLLTNFPWQMWSKDASNELYTFLKNHGCRTSLKNRILDKNSNYIGRVVFRFRNSSHSHLKYQIDGISFNDDAIVNTIAKYLNKYISE